jgi:hypothetical protein
MRPYLESGDMLIRGPLDIMEDAIMDAPDRRDDERKSGFFFSEVEISVPRTLREVSLRNMLA